MLHYFVIFLLIEFARPNNILDTLNFKDPLRKKKTLNLNESFFSSLENYHVNAKPASEKQYPWIARVIHSRFDDIPHVCTAVCIDEAIFITSARCIYTLKVQYTSVLYSEKHLPAKAFVVPSNPTKQLFDDIGFIIVETKHVDWVWAVIELFNDKNRTDEVFDWFGKLNFETKKVNYKVVGYAIQKGTHKIKVPETHYYLRELSVIVSIELCSKILTEYGKLKGFRVPCYHSCTYQQFKKKNDDKCFNYLGVEGGAVFDTLSNKLLGVATWGAYFAKFELPVGFSVVNSKNFFSDFTCARKIRDDTSDIMHVTMGYFQRLCDGKK